MGSVGNSGDNVSTRFSLYDYSCSDRENYSANGQRTCFRAKEDFQIETERLLQSSSTNRLRFEYLKVA